MASASCKKAPPPDPFAIPKEAGEVRLPMSSSTAAPAYEGRFLVYVGQEHLSFGAPPLRIARIPSTDREKGFPATVKRSGPNDLYVVPLANVVSTGEPPIDRALLFVDKDTPYRMVVEVLFTLGQRDVARFDLATKNAEGKTTAVTVATPSCAAVTMLAALEGLGALAGALGSASAAPLPTPTTPRAPEPSTSAKKLPPCPDVPRLAPAVLVARDGLSIKARGGNVAPGCKDVGPGLAIPKTGGAYDFAALGACLVSLKALQPDFASENEITVSASPGIPFETVVAVMDAARATFPTVLFGVSF